MEKNLNLYGKLLKIRKSIEYIQKNAQGKNSRYVDPAELISLIKEKMDEFDLLLYPEIIKSDLSVELKPTNNNKENREFIYRADMNYIWVDANSGEKISVPWFAGDSNMQKASFAFGGAATFTSRYFLIHFFNIPNAEDV